MYKDIHYILEDLDESGDNDIVFENGDLVIEEGDVKQSGYQTRLHDLTQWLHQIVVDRFLSETKEPSIFSAEMAEFESSFLAKDNYTSEYRIELKKIKVSLNEERLINYKGKRRGITSF